MWSKISIFALVGVVAALIFNWAANSIEVVVPVKIESYARPDKAPNGSPWPISAGYIEGYPIQKADGRSKIIAINEQNSDIFVMLVSMDREGSRPVRHFYIPAHGKFTLENVTEGEYQLHFRDLKHGSYYDTDSTFSVEETIGDNGEVIATKVHSVF